jgi:hypothetical protein
MIATGMPFKKRPQATWPFGGYRPSGAVLCDEPVVDTSGAAEPEQASPKEKPEGGSGLFQRKGLSRVRLLNFLANSLLSFGVATSDESGGYPNRLLTSEAVADAAGHACGVPSPLSGGHSGHPAEGICEWARLKLRPPPGGGLGLARA